MTHAEISRYSGAPGHRPYVFRRLRINHGRKHFRSLMFVRVLGTVVPMVMVVTNNSLTLRRRQHSTVASLIAWQVKRTLLYVSTDSLTILCQCLRSGTQQHMIALDMP